MHYLPVTLCGVSRLKWVKTGTACFVSYESFSHCLIVESHRSLLKSLLQMLRKCCSFFNGYYLCYLAADIPGFMAYYLPYNLLYNMMITRGQTKSYSSLTLSLAGIGSIVSRVLVGFAGDYKCCHRIYYFIFSMFLCGFITLACVHLTVFWQYLLYGILYGMGTGKLSYLPQLNFSGSNIFGTTNI